VRGSSSRFLFSLLVVFASPLLAPAPAAAQLTQGEARREAGTRFNEGLRLLRTRAWAGALTEFEAAYRLLPDYRVLPLIAECHEGLRHSAEAAQALERYLREGGSALSTRERQNAERSLERLLPQVHAVTVRVPLAEVEVVLDDRVVGVAPLAWRIFVTPGPHRLVARKAGHRGDPVDWTATAGGTSALDLPIRALAALGTLHVESDPAGLEVEIDGRRVGVTPHRAEVASGAEHLVLVRRAGYPPQERRLTVEPEGEERVSFTFEGQAEPAVLRFTARQRGTRVSVDGEEWNEIDDGGEEIRVAAGRHAIRVEGTGDEAIARDVDVESGDRFLLEAARGEHRVGFSSRVRWGAAAISAAVLVGAGLTGILALGEESNFDSNRERIQSGDFASREELSDLQSNARDARDSGRTLALVSDVLWIVGGLAAGGTGYLWIRGGETHVPPSLDVTEEPAR
jgi:hypothetical protein